MTNHVCVNAMNSAQLINNASIDDLRASIHCAIVNNTPFDIERIRNSLAAEQERESPRQGVIQLLKREIRRQEKIEKGAQK